SMMSPTWRSISIPSSAMRHRARRFYGMSWWQLERGEFAEHNSILFPARLRQRFSPRAISSHRFDAMLVALRYRKRPVPMNRPMHRKSLVVIGAIAAFMSAAAAQPAPPDNKPDVTLGSTPDTVVWGYISS